MSRAEIIDSLVGTPYDELERHCWWLVSTVQRLVFGREVGAVLTPTSSRARMRAVAEHPERENWAVVGCPEDGAVVLMGRARTEYHCGVYLADRRRVIHTDAPHGVVLDDILELEQHRRWRLAYYGPRIS